jgi:uncharacterized protein with GYD domain
METFIMFGKYSSEAMKAMSKERTNEALNVIKKYNGKMQSMYAILGEKDLLFVIKFPDIEHAMKASVFMSMSTGISFTTSPAVSVEEFDKMMAAL